MLINQIQNSENKDLKSMLFYSNRIRLSINSNGHKWNKTDALFEFTLSNFLRTFLIKDCFLDQYLNLKDSYFLTTIVTDNLLYTLFGFIYKKYLDHISSVYYGDFESNKMLDFELNNFQELFDDIVDR